MLSTGRFILVESVKDKSLVINQRFSRHLLFFQMTLQNGASAPESNPSISIGFTISQMAISGLKVSRLDLFGEKYKPFKGVKYITKAGRFQIRAWFWSFIIYLLILIVGNKKRDAYCPKGVNIESCTSLDFTSDLLPFIFKLERLGMSDDTFSDFSKMLIENTQNVYDSVVWRSVKYSILYLSARLDSLEARAGKMLTCYFIDLGCCVNKLFTQDTYAALHTMIKVFTIWFKSLLWLW